MAPPSKTALVDYSWLPEPLREGMKRYVVDHIRPGSFLSACLRNDLSGAAMQADPENRQRLGQIASWMVFELPDYCWGSTEKFDAWIAGRDYKHGSSTN